MRYFVYFFLFLTGFASCKKITVFEKLVDIPNHSWNAGTKAVMEFEIEDSARHQLFFLVRHTQQYRYNKLLAKLTIQDTAKHIITSLNIDASLTDEKGNWTGDKMGDLFYHLTEIQPPVLLMPGKYLFTLQHRMKEPELPYILSVGIRVDR